MNYRMMDGSVRKTLSLVVLAALAPTLFAVSAQATVTWPESQDPGKFLYLDEKLETNFDMLRTDATVDEKNGHTPWSATYWPGNVGGIAVRYQTQYGSKDASAFSAHHYSLAELKGMSQDDIKTLSPAEKFDIINGDFNYPLTARVLSTYDASTKSWEGICHGWGPAAAAYPEPQDTVITTKDGITVPVGSSDVKALISFYYAWEASQVNDRGEDNFSFSRDASGATHYTQRDPNMIPFLYRGIGERCVKGENTCGGKGLNPAAFHLSLANVVGNYQRSYVVNVVANKEIWNQPVYGYTSKIIEDKSVKVKGSGPYQIEGGSVSDMPAVRRVLINTQFYYVDEPDAVTYSAMGKPSKEQNNLSAKNLAYYLDLDANNNIIGGKWSMPFWFFRSKDRKSDKIGFAWRASRVPFLGKFSILNTLYKPEVPKTTSYAGERNFTPGLQDLYFGVDASTIPVYPWLAMTGSN